MTTKTTSKARATAAPKQEQAAQADAQEQAQQDIAVAKDPIAAAREAARKALEDAPQQPADRSLAEARDEADEDAVETQEMQVLIERDPMTKIASTILAYELPILFLINGADRVHVVSGSERDVEVVGFDADAEMAALYRKYGRSGEDAVRRVYGDDGRRLSEELGLSYRINRGANYRAPAETALVRDHSSANRTVESRRTEVRIARDGQKASTRSTRAVRSK